MFQLYHFRHPVWLLRIVEGDSQRLESGHGNVRPRNEMCGCTTRIFFGEIFALASMTSGCKNLPGKRHTRKLKTSGCEAEMNWKRFLNLWFWVSLSFIYSPCLCHIHVLISTALFLKLVTLWHFRRLRLRPSRSPQPRRPFSDDAVY